MAVLLDAIGMRPRVAGGIAAGNVAVRVVTVRGTSPQMLDETHSICYPMRRWSALDAFIADRAADSAPDDSISR
jgi:hypothetical protein